MIFVMKFKDGGSPDARLRLARLGAVRLRLNDGAKLWVPSNFASKQIILPYRMAKKSRFSG